MIADFETTPPPPALPPDSDMAFVVRLLQRVREYGMHLSPLPDPIEEFLRARDLTPEDAIRGEHQRQAAAQVSIANVLTSLRRCSTLNWSDYFEAVSLVEHILQRDPSGTYGAMDFLSRDRLRQAVEELAAPTGDAQMRVALRAIESARQGAGAESMNDRSGHVGYHLVGEGRRDLEVDVGYRPKASKRIGRVVRRWPGTFYFTSIGSLTALLIAAGLFYYKSQGGNPERSLWVALLLLIPATEVAIV